MDIHTATEQAYRNGYEAGKRDAEPKWIPVTERLPTFDDIPDYADYDYHLVCCKSPISGRCTVQPALASYDGFADKCLISCHGLTHWMPLPKPPTE